MATPLVQIGRTGMRILLAGLVRPVPQANSTPTEVEAATVGISTLATWCHDVLWTTTSAFSLASDEGKSAWPHSLKPTVTPPHPTVTPPHPTVTPPHPTTVTLPHPTPPYSAFSIPRGVARSCRK